MGKRDQVAISPSEFSEFANKFLSPLGGLGLLCSQMSLDDLGPGSPIKAAVAFNENMQEYMANGVTLYAEDLRGLAEVGRYYREFLKPVYASMVDENSRKRFQEAVDYLEHLLPQEYKTPSRLR